MFIVDEAPFFSASSWKFGLALCSLLVDNSFPSMGYSHLVPSVLPDFAWIGVSIRAVFYSL